MEQSAKQILSNAFAGEANAPEKITFANDSVATSAPAVQWLGDAVIGLVEQNGLVEARKFIAPDWKSFYSNTEASYPYFERAENFRNEEYDKLERAVGGEFKRITAHRGRRAVELQQVGLSIALEKNQANNDPGYKQRCAQKLINIIESATLVEAITKLESTLTEDWQKMEWNSSTYEVGNNPDAYLRKAMVTAGDKAGVDITNIWYGRLAWLRRRQWFDSFNTSGAFMAARSVSELSTDLDATVKIPIARLNDGTSLNFPNVARDSIYGFFSMSGTEDVSNIKTIIGKDGGLSVYESEHPQGQMTLLTVARWQAVVVTSPIGAFKISVTEDGTQS